MNRIGKDIGSLLIKSRAPTLGKTSKSLSGRFHSGHKVAIFCTYLKRSVRYHPVLAYIQY